MQRVEINLEPSGSLETVIGTNSNIRSGSVIYRGSSIGRNFTTGHSVLLRENCMVGDNVSIGSHSICEHSVRIGNNVRIHSGVFIPEYTVIEGGAWIGPRVVFTNSKYPNQEDSKHNLKGVTVKLRAIIGANATILPGLIIGENSIVGAGSVVTKDVPPGAIVYGNPAREDLK